MSFHNLVLCVFGLIACCIAQAPLEFNDPNTFQLTQFQLSANNWAYTLLSVENLIYLPQYGAAYNNQVIFIKEHFQPDIVLNIDGLVFVGAQAVVDSLTQPGSLPHPNPTPLPRLIDAVPQQPCTGNNNGNQGGCDNNGCGWGNKCTSHDVFFACDYVPAMGVYKPALPDIEYQLQVIQQQSLHMRKRCINGRLEPYYRLQALNVTNSLLVATGI